LIFIDTGAFISRYVKRDQYYLRSQSHWKLLISNREQLITSHHVLDETFTLLARRTSHAFATGRAKIILNSSELQVLRSTVEDELAALSDFEKFSDQKISFTDCISFALMRRFGIQKVFAFDHHFSLAGFALEPN